MNDEMMGIGIESDEDSDDSLSGISDSEIASSFVQHHQVEKL
jgi:hypothetical protein